MTTGFTQAGFTPVLAVEHDRHAAATYAANHGADHTYCGDIAELPDAGIPGSVDVVIGGPPCQGFSAIGLQDPRDPRNQLWREYLRVVTHARPRVFVMENVPQFARSPEFQLLLNEADHGVLAGYDLSWGVLNAADYGTAQRRKRVIVIGSRVGKVRLPLPTHGRRAGLWLKPWETIRSRIEWLLDAPLAPSLPRRVTPSGVPGYFAGLELHLERADSLLSRERYAHIPPGGGFHDLPDRLLPARRAGRPSGQKDSMGRMVWDDVAPTLRTEFDNPTRGQGLHPQWVKDDPARSVNRSITALEGALLQDFPFDYKWCGPKTGILRQVGNAVPVSLAAAIARHVAVALAGAAGPRGRGRPRE